MGQSFATALTHAIVALGAFCVIGYAVGALACRAVEESFKAELAKREQAASQEPETEAE